LNWKKIDFLNREKRTEGWNYDGAWWKSITLDFGTIDDGNELWEVGERRFWDEDWRTEQLDWDWSFSLFVLDLILSLFWQRQQQIQRLRGGGMVPSFCSPCCVPLQLFHIFNMYLTK
jgi:hypothetical protein